MSSGRGSSRHTAVKVFLTLIDFSSFCFRRSEKNFSYTNWFFKLLLPTLIKNRILLKISPGPGLLIAFMVLAWGKKKASFKKDQQITPLHTQEHRPLQYDNMPTRYSTAQGCCICSYNTDRWFTTVIWL